MNNFNVVEELARAQADFVALQEKMLAHTQKSAVDIAVLETAAAENKVKVRERMPH